MKPLHEMDNGALMEVILDRLESFEEDTIHWRLAPAEIRFIETAKEAAGILASRKSIQEVMSRHD